MGNGKQKKNGKLTESCSCRGILDTEESAVDLVDCSIIIHRGQEHRALQIPSPEGEKLIMGKNEQKDLETDLEDLITGGASSCQDRLQIFKDFLGLFRDCVSNHVPLGVQ